MQLSIPEKMNIDYVYIIYTIAELQELLRMSHTTVTKLLYELDSVHGIGLIERYRQGNNRPSVIYVKNFVKRIRGKPVRYFASGTPETGNPDCKELEIRIARNWKSGTQKNRSPDCKNLDGSNTKINKTENILKNFIGMLYYQIDIGMW